MADLYTSLLREFAQKAVGVIALWLTAHGLNLPTSVKDWVTLTAVAGGLWLWTALLRWLETRPDNAAAGRFAQWVARLLMLGIGRTPTYPAKTDR